MSRRLVAAMLAVAAVVGVSRTGSARAAQGPPAFEFRPVLAELPPPNPTTPADPVGLVAAHAAVASCDEGAVAQLVFVPTTVFGMSAPDDCVVFPVPPGDESAGRYYLGPARRVAIADARAKFETGQGWVVVVEFTKSGAKAWDGLARQQFHRQIAITHAGIIVVAPMIQPDGAKFRSFGGVIVLGGPNFTKRVATILAKAARP